MDATKLKFTYPMDRMLAHLFPWLGIIAGPIASLLFVRQWNPENWMVTTLHVVNAVSMIQILHLLLRDPQLRWALFAIATMQLIAWFMAWGWSTVQDSKYPNVAVALYDVEGRDRLRYVHLAMSVSFIAILGGALISWSHALQTLPAGSILYLIALLVLSGFLYVLFEVEPKESTVADMIAILNLGIALYVITTFFVGYRTHIDALDLWRPFVRWFFEVSPERPISYWINWILGIGVASALAFLALVLAVYIRYYRKEVPSPRPLRVMVGTSGTLGLFHLFLAGAFLLHMGGIQNLKTLTYDDLLHEDDGKGRPLELQSEK